MVGKRRITDCGVVAVVVASVGSSTGSISRGSADYGFKDYGFVRITDCARISCGCGLRDCGLFWEALKFATIQLGQTAF